MTETLRHPIVIDREDHRAFLENAIDRQIKNLHAARNTVKATGAGTHDIDYAIQMAENLKIRYKSQLDMGVSGTPIGDAISAERIRGEAIATPAEDPANPGSLGWPVHVPEPRPKVGDYIEYEEGDDETSEAITEVKGYTEGTETKLGGFIVGTESAEMLVRWDAKREAWRLSYAVTEEEKAQGGEVLTGTVAESADRAHDDDDDDDDDDEAGELVAASGGVVGEENEETFANAEVPRSNARKRGGGGGGKKKGGKGRKR